MVRKVEGPDWTHLSWHYRAIHASIPVWHDPFVRVRARGLDRLPREGAFLYAGNHSSWWDPIVMALSTGRPVHWLAKKELLESRFGRWFFGRGGCIPVDRSASADGSAYDAAFAALRDGRVIGIFPEGSRGDGQTLREAKSGVGRLALATGAPVVPAAVLTDRFWPRGRRLPRFREPVYLDVGEPIRFDGDPNDRGAVRAVGERVMDEIGSLLEAARAARDAGERWPRP